MKTVVVIVLLVALAHITICSAAACNDTCYGNNDCANNYCVRCENKTCQKGLPCNSACEVDTDCDIISGCTLCTNKVCTANPHGCGAKCVNNNDCQDSVCTACLSDMCVPGWGCNHDCLNDKDCNIQGNCRYCVKNKCSAPCLGKCTSDDDCEPGCNKCVDGLCRTSF